MSVLTLRQGHGGAFHAIDLKLTLHAGGVVGRGIGESLAVISGRAVAKCWREVPAAEARLVFGDVSCKACLAAIAKEAPPRPVDKVHVCASHDGVAVEGLAYVGIQEIGPDAPPLALYKSHCGTTLARDLQSLMHCQIGM